MITRLLTPILLVVTLLSCSSPDMVHEGIDVHCSDECPPLEQVAHALTQQREMWGRVTGEQMLACGVERIRWPSGHTVDFWSTRGLPYNAAGYYVPHTQYIAVDATFAQWQHVLDHEVGMAALGAKGGTESSTIEKRKCMGVCYPAGDTGYCKGDAP